MESGQQFHTGARAPALRDFLGDDEREREGLTLREPCLTRPTDARVVLINSRKKGVNGSGGGEESGSIERRRVI